MSFRQCCGVDDVMSTMFSIRLTVGVLLKFVFFVFSCSCFVLQFRHIGSKLIKMRPLVCHVLLDLRERLYTSLNIIKYNNPVGVVLSIREIPTIYIPRQYAQIKN
jgi:hypothetical protein